MLFKIFFVYLSTYFIVKCESKNVSKIKFYYLNKISNMLNEACITPILYKTFKGFE